MVFSLFLLSSLRPMTVRVDGEGYIRLMAEGRHVFAKQCSLVVKGGRLAASDGPALMPTIPVPGDPTGLKIGLDGTVTAFYPTGDRTLGRIVLGDFPADVRPVKAGNYFVCYGKPDLGNPGEGTFGVVRTEGAKSETVAVHALAKVGAVTVNLPENLALDSEQLTLGDLATGLPDVIAKLDLGAVPPVGVTRTISRVQISDRLKRVGYAAQFSGSVNTVVTRAGQTVTHNQFVAAALGKARQDLSAEPTPTTSGPSMVVPKGTLDLVVEAAQISGQTEKVTVAVYVGGQRFNSRVVGFRASAPVARALTTGQVVDVIVKKGALSVQTKGTVRRVDKGQVTVEVEPSKAQVVGIVNALGQVEVSA